MLREVQSEIRVRYAETDAQQVVHHATYLVYFEVGRGDLLRAAEIDYNAIEAGGVFVVVVEAGARYHAPARYNDPLTLETRLTELRSRTMRFEYRVLRREFGGGETLIASGFTTHVALNAAGRPVRLPAAMLG